MRWRILALSLAFASFLVAAYFGWASYRISGPVLFEEARAGNPNWPRKWPYPDEWLWRWNDQLDAEDPGAPGTLKMRGELPTMKMKLMGWIFVSGLIGICLAVLGLRLVPYVSFTVTTPETVSSVIERLSARINPNKSIGPSVDQDRYQGDVWKSGFQMMKLRTVHGDCPIVFCGRFVPWSGGGGLEIKVTARLFRPLLWFLFVLFGAMALAIACALAMVESDKTGWFYKHTQGDLLDVLYALVGMFLLSWAAMVAWFRFGGRKSLEQITQLLSTGCPPVDRPS